MRIFSFAGSTGLHVPSSAWTVPAPAMSPPSGGQALMQMAPPKEGNGHNRPAGLGHNSGTGDPGTATDFDDRGPLAIRKGSVQTEKLDAFYEAVRSQGSAGVRQAAISNTLARARANPTIRHHDYRLLEQIASCSRWEYRYCCQSNKALAYFAAQADPKNIGRSLSSLISAGVVAGVDVPRQIGGWPVTYYTIRCSAEDRSNQTLGNLNEDFKAAVSSRQPDDLLPSSRPPDDDKPGQVVPQTTCKSSGGGVASRPPDAQSVYRGSVDRGSEEPLGADAPGVDATLFPDAAPTKGANWKPTKPEIEKGFTEWWAHYPKKEDKGDARKAYERRVTHPDAKERATIPQLLAAVKAYPFKSDRQYIKHPATWLNKGSWMEVCGTSEAGIDAEVQRLAGTETGRAMIGDMGRDRALQAIRKDVLRRRGGASD